MICEYEHDKTERATVEKVSDKATAFSSEWRVLDNVWHVQSYTQYTHNKIRYLGPPWDDNAVVVTAVTVSTTFSPPRNATVVGMIRP
jgi:hypothetical protein